MNDYRSTWHDAKISMSRQEKSHESHDTCYCSCLYRLCLGRLQQQSQQQSQRQRAGKSFHRICACHQPGSSPGTGKYGSHAAGYERYCTIASNTGRTVDRWALITPQ